MVYIYLIMNEIRVKTGLLREVRDFNDELEMNFEE